MRSIALVLTCLACAGYGRRTQIMMDRLDRDAQEVHAGQSSEGTNNPQSLAELKQSQSWSPTAAFQASRPVSAPGAGQNSHPAVLPPQVAGTLSAPVAPRVASTAPAPATPGAAHDEHPHSPTGSAARETAQAQMMDPQLHMALNQKVHPGIHFPHEKIARERVKSKTQAPQSEMPRGRLAALVLFLASSVSMPALAFARERCRSGKRQGGSWTQHLWRRRAPAAVLSAAATADAPTGSSVSSSIINLAKNIVGSGVLALAAGVAAFSASPIGVVPAIAVLLGLGAASGYSFALISRVGSEVGQDNYSDIWAKLFGSGTKIIPAITITFMTLAAGLSYSIILGDSFASIASLAGLPAILCAPNTWILGLSAFLLLPLSLLRDLSSLAIGSVIGTAGTLYTALFIWLRLADGTYAAGGKFFSMLAENAQPMFAAHTAARPLVNPAIFVLVSMLSTAFLAHYNAPKFFKELAPPADGSSKETAFNKVVAGSFGLASLICVMIMAGGFLTFGGASQGLILNNYATTDPLAFLARLGICASIIFSYPLNFVGLREGVLNLLKLDGSKNSIHVTSTLIFLCTMNGASLVVKDLGLVTAVGGALLGSALVYIYPAMMFIQATRVKRKALEAEGKQLPGGRLREMYANYGLVGLGFMLAVIGVKMSLKAA